MSILSGKECGKLGPGTSPEGMGTRAQKTTPTREERVGKKNERVLAQGKGRSRNTIKELLED